MRRVKLRRPGESEFKEEIVSEPTAQAPMAERVLPAAVRPKPGAPGGPPANCMPQEIDLQNFTYGYVQGPCPHCGRQLNNGRRREFSCDFCKRTVYVRNADLVGVWTPILMEDTEGAPPRGGTVSTPESAEPLAPVREWPASIVEAAALVVQTECDLSKAQEAARQAEEYALELERKQYEGRAEGSATPPDVLASARKVAAIRLSLRDRKAELVRMIATEEAGAFDARRARIQALKDQENVTFGRAAKLLAELQMTLASIGCCEIPWQPMDDPDPERKGFLLRRFVKRLSGQTPDGRLVGPMLVRHAAFAKAVEELRDKTVTQRRANQERVRTEAEFTADPGPRAEQLAEELLARTRI